jgi:hypothetical protein
MAAINIVLADAQATPVNHTFVPLGPDKNGVFWFEDQSATSAIGFWRISMSITRPGVATSGQSSAGRVNRIKIAINEPILETVSNNTVSGIAPAPTVAYTSRYILEAVLPERATFTDKQTMRKMMLNLLGEAQVTALMELTKLPF